MVTSSRLQVHWILRSNGMQVLLLLLLLCHELAFNDTVQIFQFIGSNFDFSLTECTYQHECVICRLMRRIPCNLLTNIIIFHILLWLLKLTFRFCFSLEQNVVFLQHGVGHDSRLLLSVFFLFFFQELNMDCCQIWMDQYHKFV